MPRLIAITAIVLGAFLPCAVSHADLVGLVVFREEVGGSGVAPPGPPRWIYRVYAEFTSSTDSILGWGVGTTEFGFGSIWNITEGGAPGSGFTNVPNTNTSNTAPMFPNLFSDWDTYMTIGLQYGFQGPGNVDYTNVFPGTPMFIANGATSWTGISAGVSLSPNTAQGYAGYRVSGNDTDQRVLLMQLVVNEGEHVAGSIGLGWRTSPGNLVFSPDLPFSSIPSPHSVTILAFLLVRCRRRI